MAPSDFVSRGQALVASGQYQEAVKICRLGLLGRPTAVEGRVVLGQALLALRRYDEVLAEMRVALELDNTSAAAYQLKGEALLRKGDPVGAVESLTRARQLAPADPSIAALIAEAEIAREGSAPGVGGLGYVDLGDSMTKHYPSHQGNEPTGSDSYTRPTSLQKPEKSHTGATPGMGSPSDFGDELETRGQRPSVKPKPSAELIAPTMKARGDATPPPHVLSVGDRSGTVEVDPDVDGVEMDDDIGELAEPPPSVDEPLVPPARGKPSAKPNPTRRGAAAVPAKPRKKAPSKPQGPGAGHFLPMPSGQPPPGSLAAAKKTPTLSIEDDDLIEVDSGISMIETPAPIDLDEIDRQARLRAQQRAMQVPAGMASGPLPDNPLGPPRAPPGVSAAQLAAADRPTAIGGAVPPHLRPPTMSPGPGAVAAVQNAPRAPNNAAMPTVAGMAGPPQAGLPPPRPGMPMQGGMPGNPAAAMPTMAISPAMQRSAAAVDQMFPDEQVAVGAAMPSWAKNTMVAPGANNIPPPPHGGGMPPPGGGFPPGMGMGPGAAPPGAKTARPGPAVTPDPGAIGDFTGLLVQPTDPSQTPREDTGSGRHHRTGVRTPRKFKIAMWAALAVVVIGGGVFAGFQIRRIRLDRQIDTATAAADAAAKPDTWLGWIKARDGYAGIVNARDTDATRAKVARARALLAADFGDDLAGARQAVDALKGGGGTDGNLARAYVAIAGGDAAAAQKEAQIALDKAPDEAAAHAVVGRAALLGHRWTDAARELRIAVDKDARPSYLASLAEAELARRHLDDARTACDRALAMVNDHPATLIIRARVLAAGGKLASPQIGAEVTGQLERVIAEGQRAFSDQTVGVSPRQATDAALALVTVQIARNDAQGARTALDRATATRPGDQRFAEQVVRAYVELGQYTQAKAEAKTTLEKWPQSITARIGLAQALLVDGDAGGALEALSQAGSLDAEPEALALRGSAYLAMNDLDNAKKDLDAAIAIAPGLDAAVVGRALVDIKSGEAGKAVTELEPLYGARASDPAIATAYAAALRQTGSVDQARTVLRPITEGPEGPGVADAWLELGRLERQAGDYEAARKAYGKAIAGRSRDAKLEAAQLYIDNSDVTGGHDTLEELIKQAPEDGPILIETARARTLLGDLAGAHELIARAEKLSPAPDGFAREKGRLELKESDSVHAIVDLQEATKVDERDLEAHLLLLDAIHLQNQPKLAQELLEPAKKRFGDRPERYLIMGKVALIVEDYGEAKKAFDSARKEMEAKKAPPRRAAEALIGLGLCAMNTNDLATAARDFNEATKKDPVAVDAWALLGQIAEFGGNQRSAFGYYQNAVKYNPAYAAMQLALGKTAVALGKTQIAKDALTKFLELAPSGSPDAVEAKRLLSRL